MVGTRVAIKKYPCGQPVEIKSYPQFMHSVFFSLYKNVHS